MPLRVTAHIVTDCGLKRQNNEDFVAGRDGGPAAVLYVVADGMGGHIGGEQASKMAAQTILDVAYAPDLVHARPAERLVRAFEQANDAIRRESGTEPEGWRMGTTAVAALVQDNVLTVANVGDSRAYLIHDGAIEQVSVDHRSDLGQNVLTRALGGHEEVLVDTFCRRLTPGDAIVLCTDGLVRYVADAEIAHAVSRGSGEAAIQDLINLAKERGGADNITVALLLLAEGEGIAGQDETTTAAASTRVAAAPLPSGSPPPTAAVAHTRRSPYYLWAGIAVVLVAIAGGVSAFLATRSSGHTNVTSTSIPAAASPSAAVRPTLSLDVPATGTPLVGQPAMPTTILVEPAGPAFGSASPFPAPTGATPTGTSPPTSAPTLAAPAASAAATATPTMSPTTLPAAATATSAAEAAQETATKLKDILLATPTSRVTPITLAPTTDTLIVPTLSALN